MYTTVKKIDISVHFFDTQRSALFFKMLIFNAIILWHGFG